MRVHIDGVLEVECSHFLPDRWNGWVQPVFTELQLGALVSKCVGLGWVGSVEEMGKEITDLGNYEYVTNGYIWQVVEEGK